MVVHHKIECGVNWEIYCKILMDVENDYKKAKHNKGEFFMKKITSFLVIICMLMVLVPIITVDAAENLIEFAGGDGSQSNPYKVSNLEHLNNVRYYLSAHFIQVNDINMTAATASGGAFYNGGAGWAPIGDDWNPFTGNYDGNSFKIIGLMLNKTTVYAGLFGYSYGIIKNLGMVNGTIYGSYCVGGIVGHNGGISGFNEKDGMIINCYNASIVSTVITSPVADVGGIAGRNYGIINNCYNTGNVSGYSSNYNSIVGGIAADNSGTISNCYNIGGIAASYGAGGIVGTNSKTVTNCYNTGNISGVYKAAGIVAHSMGIINNCYNTGNITAGGADVVFAGGLVGYATTLSGSGTITSGYSIGDVTATATYIRVGKVIGYNYGAKLNSLYFLGTSADSGVGIYDGNPKDPVEPLNSEQLRTKESLTDFDFDNIWAIVHNRNNGYPILRSLTHTNLEGEIINFSSSGTKYSFDIEFTNSTFNDITTKVYAVAYNGGKMTGLSVYDLTNLTVGNSTTIENVIIVSSETATHIKIICMDSITLEPVGQFYEKIL